MIWRAERSGGGTGVRRMLTERRWAFRERNAKALRIFAGTPPPPGPFPHPPVFETRLGSSSLRFASGWGAFSEDRIDPGTRLLFDVASQQTPVPVVLDVGTGYGPLAIGLVAAGKAERALGTDIDSVALALADMNAASTQQPLAFELTDDPSMFQEAALVVCNFPTHAERVAADVLVAALTRLASTARVLVVVHASLEPRFTDRFAAMGGRATVEARAEHAVLSVARDARR